MLGTHRAPGDLIYEIVCGCARFEEPGLARRIRCSQRFDRGCASAKGDEARGGFVGFSFDYGNVYKRPRETNVQLSQMSGVIRLAA